MGEGSRVGGDVVSVAEDPTRWEAKEWGGSGEGAAGMRHAR